MRSEGRRAHCIALIWTDSHSRSPFLYARRKLKRKESCFTGNVTLSILYVKSPFLRKGQARLRAGDRPTKKHCETSRHRQTLTSLCVTFSFIPLVRAIPLPPFQRKRVSLEVLPLERFHVKHDSFCFTNFGELYKKEFCYVSAIHIRAIRCARRPSLLTPHS